MNRHAIHWLASWALCLLFSLGASNATAAAGNENGPDPDRYLVKFSKGENASAARRAISSAGGKVLVEIPGARAAAARIPAQALQGLRRNPTIEFIERDLPRVPMAQTVPYGLPLVQADQVTDVAQLQIKVCVIDSGVDAGHEDFLNSIITGTSLPSSDGGVIAWDTDQCGHGTHVAGTILAQDNSLGVLGVAPRVPMHIVNVFETQTFGSCDITYTSTVLSAADACLQAGADIISMSLGCTDDQASSCSSAVEDAYFQTLYDQGVLLVAAAGNDGSTLPGYPASYASVISVAAVDENSQVAGFSQQNNEVELAAPGVAVLSTVPTGSGASSAILRVADVEYSAIVLEGSPAIEASGELVDCGLAFSPCTAAAGGNICLIQRGDTTFAEKVTNCQEGGGSAAVIYNNIPGVFFGTLGSTVTQIPSAGISQSDGEQLLANALGAQTLLSVDAENYDFKSGTSMATPHVTGAAALVWSQYPDWTNTQIREALGASATDLGPVGRDSAYGYGLVQSRAALDYLTATTGFPVEHASLAVISNFGQPGVNALSVALWGGVRYAANVFGWDGALLNRVPLSPEPVKAHFVVADLNGNGADELVSLEVSGNGWVQAKVKDSITGELINNVPFQSDYEPLWARVLPDSGLDGSVDVAVLGVRSDGRPRVQVRDVLSGAPVSKVYFESAYEPFAFEIIEDLSGNGVPELAVLGTDDAGRVRAQVKDAVTGELISFVFFDRRYTPSHAVGVDTDGDGDNDALAVLGEDAFGTIRAQVKDLSTANLLGLVRFETGYVPHALVALPDVNSSGTPELAVLHSDGFGDLRAQVKDAVTGQTVNIVSFDASYETRDMVLIPDVDGNTHPELAVLGEGPVGNYLLQVKDAVTGQPQVFVPIE